jgi:kumamolisin
MKAKRGGMMKGLSVIGMVLAPFVVASATWAAPLAGGPVVAGVPRVPVRDMGPAPATMPVRLAVVLRYRNEAQLRAFVAEQPYLKPQFRVLTRRQFWDTFSPSVADYARTIGLLQREGFQIVKTYPNRTVIDVVGPAGLVNRVFGTEIHRVVQTAVPGGMALGAAGAVRYANARPAILPAELRPTVYGVIGFDNLQVLHPLWVRGQRGASPMVALGPPLQGPDTGLGPYAFATAYDYPVQHQVKGGSLGQTYDGTGQSAAIVIDSDYTESDLSTFLSFFGITRTGPPTVRIPIQGGPNPPINFDGIETTLDIETIVGMAPGTAVYLYLPNALLYASIIDAYNQIDTDDLVEAVNSSFGGCETFTDPSYFPQLSDYLALQGEALGITYSASTGDSGTFECTFSAPGGVSTPASGPHFVAAGGTTLILHLNGTYAREFGWSGSGGGVSALFAKPAYQSGIPHAAGPMRNIPDVGLDANPGSGAAFYYQGAWQGPIGGTSLSSPLFVAMVVEWDQIHGAPLGDVHPLLYNLFKAHHYAVVNGLPLFRDVIGGNNGFYNATRGYDNVTGIGSVEAWGFASAAQL